MTHKNFYIFFVGFIFLSVLSFGQNRPIGYWRSHLPYNTSVGLATNGIKLFAACNQSFFTCNLHTTPQPYSKVEGMSDIGMACVGYDFLTSTTIFAYKNGTIDLFYDSTSASDRKQHSPSTVDSTTQSIRE